VLGARQVETAADLCVPVGLGNAGAENSKTGVVQIQDGGAMLC